MVDKDNIVSDQAVEAAMLRYAQAGKEPGTDFDDWRKALAAAEVYDPYGDKARIRELEEALRDALEGFEDGSNYKGDYLREKHGDADEIARLRTVLDLT